MKRFFKKNSKRGFTLLEVMLATAIMTICSTMIMKGFLSTMNYAHNNNVYNKMGAKNYDAALAKVTTMVAYGDGDGLQKRIDAIKSDTAGSAGKVTIKITEGGATSGLDGADIIVQQWEYNDNTGVNLSNTVKGAYAEGASAVSHRHSFFYQPSVTACPKGAKHPVRYCVVAADKSGDSNGWYCRESSCDYCKNNTKIK